MAGPNEKPAPKKHERVGTILSLEYGTPEAPGYHTLASLMGRDGEYAVFRKFSSLNMLNLMRYQAELLDLEERYKLSIFKNEKGRNDVPLATSFKELNGSNSDQKEILDEIRTKLDEYNSALLKCSQVTSLSTSRKSGLKFIRDWLYGGQDGEGKGFITKSSDVETLTWSEEHKRDFVTIRNDSERDIWTSILVTKILKFWHGTLGRWKKPEKELGVVEYTGLQNTTKVIITVLSAMIPALSVLALFFEKNLLKRIWIMIGLTMAFATMLSVFTGAKRIEIFSAVAAFAAVEVIFIGSTDVGNKLATATVAS